MTARAPGLRLFVAVPAPPVVRAAASSVIERLRGSEEVRWVAPELLHLTLKFLGSTPSEKVEGISAALTEKANRFSRFMVELGDAGAFPNLRRPQTIWMGVGGDVRALERLAEAVEQALVPLGFPREKRGFRPHLTIGRVKSSRGLPELARRLLGSAARAELESVPWPVEEIHLVQSVLKPSGPEYTPVRVFRLGGEE
jgi:2'-5' RNA ligase